jgi:hypothetical protein
MYNEPERVLELYRNRKMLDLEDQLARDIQQADEYIKSLVAQGMRPLEAEERAMELVVAPRGGPADSENPLTSVPEDLQEKIIDRIEALEEVFQKKPREEGSQPTAQELTGSGLWSYDPGGRHVACRTSFTWRCPNVEPILWP